MPGRPAIWMKVGQWLTALAVGAVGGCLDIFTLVYPFSSLSPSLWETARYRLKYCLKGPLNPKQPINNCYICTCISNNLARNCTKCQLKHSFSILKVNVTTEGRMIKMVMKWACPSGPSHYFYISAWISK